MNVNQLIECMDFMTSAKEDIMLEYGKNLVFVSMYYQFVPLLMIEFYVCTEA